MPGKIKVKILAGRNLPVMDRSGDTTDAYVEIKFGNTTYKTDVCRKSLNPQWNSEWYRFEVDDAELQDEPLQVRLMDHDTYSANDAIGKVYVNLNPLLLPGLPPAVKNIWTLEATMNSSIGSQGGSVMTGWIPVFDTMHGIRGEVNIIVKVELFSDCNKFRQSSCGVQFFYSPNIPHGYHAQVIHGFVEELVVSDDPEYKWIDKIRTPRASNEARQTLFFKLSGEVQRKIGLKALDLGGNAVIGYVQNFDLEGESGIVARGIGTAVTLVKLQDISVLPIETSNIEDLTSFCLQSKNLYDLSESDDSLPLLSHSPNLTAPLSRSPTNLHPTSVSNRFPKRERASSTRRRDVRISEYRAPSLRSRQHSLQHSPIGNNPTRKGATSSLSLADDLISESSLMNMLALEDMRGEPASNAFSRGLKNFRYLHKNILPRRVAEIKSKITDSFDDESDQESTYSSTWSLAGSESNRSPSIADLRQSIRRKKFTHKKKSADGIAALLIRSVHSGFPLDSVREDRETPTPSPVNFLDDRQDCGENRSRSAGTNDTEAIADSNEESTSSQIEDNYSESKILLGKRKKRDVKYTSEHAIPMMSSSETDTSTSDEEPSESSTNYNILDDSYSIVDPGSADERKTARSIRRATNTGQFTDFHGKIEKRSARNEETRIEDTKEEDRYFAEARDEHFESSTDYNILDDNCSIVETNSIDDAGFEANLKRFIEGAKIGGMLDKNDFFELSEKIEESTIKNTDDIKPLSVLQIDEKIESNFQGSESSANYNILDDTYSIVDPGSADERKTAQSIRRATNTGQFTDFHGKVEKRSARNEVTRIEDTKEEDRYFAEARDEHFESSTDYNILEDNCSIVETKSTNLKRFIEDAKIGAMRDKNDFFELSEKIEESTIKHTDDIKPLSVLQIDEKIESNFQGSAKILSSTEEKIDFSKPSENIEAPSTESSDDQNFSTASIESVLSCTEEKMYTSEASEKLRVPKIEPIDNKNLLSVSQADEKFETNLHRSTEKIDEISAMQEEFAIDSIKSSEKIEASKTESTDKNRLSIMRADRTIESNYNIPRDRYSSVDQSSVDDEKIESNVRRAVEDSELPRIPAKIDEISAMQEEFAIDSIKSSEKIEASKSESTDKNRLSIMRADRTIESNYNILRDRYSSVDPSSVDDEKIESNVRRAVEDSELPRIPEKIDEISAMQEEFAIDSIKSSEKIEASKTESTDKNRLSIMRADRTIESNYNILRDRYSSVDPISVDDEKIESNIRRAVEDSELPRIPAKIDEISAMQEEFPIDSIKSSEKIEASKTESTDKNRLSIMRADRTIESNYNIPRDKYSSVDPSSVDDEKIESNIRRAVEDSELPRIPEKIDEISAMQEEFPIDSIKSSEKIEASKIESTDKNRLSIMRADRTIESNYNILRDRYSSVDPSSVDDEKIESNIRRAVEDSELPRIPAKIDEISAMQEEFAIDSIKSSEKIEASKTEATDKNRLSIMRADRTIESNYNILRDKYSSVDPISIDDEKIESNIRRAEEDSELPRIPEKIDEISAMQEEFAIDSIKSSEKIEASKTESTDKSRLSIMRADRTIESNYNILRDKYSSVDPISVDDEKIESNIRRAVEDSELPRIPEKIDEISAMQEEFPIDSIKSSEKIEASKIESTDKNRLSIMRADRTIESNYNILRDKYSSVDPISVDDEKIESNVRRAVEDSELPRIPAKIDEISAIQKKFAIDSVNSRSNEFIESNSDDYNPEENDRLFDQHDDLSRYKLDPMRVIDVPKLSEISDTRPTIVSVILKKVVKEPTKIEETKIEPSNVKNLSFGSRSDDEKTDNDSKVLDDTLLKCIEDLSGNNENSSLFTEVEEILKSNTDHRIKDESRLPIDRSSLDRRNFDPTIERTTEVPRDSNRSRESASTLSLFSEKIEEASVKQEEIGIDRTVQENPTTTMLRDCHSTSSTNYHFLDECCSPIEAGSIDPKKIEQIRGFEIGNICEIRSNPELISPTKRTVDDVLETRESMEIEPEISETLSISQSDEKLESSTDYNILDDTSLIEPVALDDWVINSGLRHAIEFVKLPENPTSENRSSEKSAEIVIEPEIKDNALPLGLADTSNILATLPLSPNLNELTFDCNSTRSVSPLPRSSPSTKLKHLKFLPKQISFDSGEDPGFVTSTPVDTDLSVIPNFDPKEKSSTRRSFEATKSDCQTPIFPGEKRTDLPDFETSDRSLSKVLHDDERSSIAEKIDDHRDKQVCFDSREDPGFVTSTPVDTDLSIIPNFDPKEKSSTRRSFESTKSDCQTPIFPGEKRTDLPDFETSDRSLSKVLHDDERSSIAEKIDDHRDKQFCFDSCEDPGFVTSTPVDTDPSLIPNFDPKEKSSTRRSFESTKSDCQTPIFPGEKRTDLPDFETSDRSLSKVLHDDERSSIAEKIDDHRDKQVCFDSCEDPGFVTSTPVDTDLSVIPNFDPKEKSSTRRSFESTKSDCQTPIFPGEKRTDLPDFETSDRSLSKVLHDDERSSISEKINDHLDKQVCPLGLSLDKITKANQIKIGKSSKSVENNRTDSVELPRSATTVVPPKSADLPDGKNVIVKRDRSKKVERTDTVIYKGPAKDRFVVPKATKPPNTARPVNPIPIVVAPPPEEHATRLQVPVIRTTNINVQSTFSPDEMKTQHFGSIGSRKFPLDDRAIGEKFGRKYRQHCMLDLIRTIDAKMMIHHAHHDRRDSTKSRRKRRDRVNASATPSPDSIHRTRSHRRRSRSRSPDRQHSHPKNQVSSLTTHSFPVSGVSSLKCPSPNPQQESPSCDSSYENLSRSNTNPPIVLCTSMESDAVPKENTISPTNDDRPDDRPTSRQLTAEDGAPVEIAAGAYLPNEPKVGLEEFVETTMSLLRPNDTDHPVFKSHSAGSLERLRERFTPITKNTNESNTIDDLCVPRSPLTPRQPDEQQQQSSSPLQVASALPSSLGSKVETINSTVGTKTNNAVPNMHRRSSDSDLSITPKGNSLAGSDRSMGGHLRPSTAIVRTMNQDTMEMLEYPFITMQQYPAGFVLNIGGLVSARSVKLLERITNLEEPEGRDAWWTEIRMEVRSHARALACNVVLGYKEEISICDDVCVLNASGTAAVINLLNASQDQDSVLLSRTIMTTSVESERDAKNQVKSSNTKSDKSEDNSISGQAGKVKRTSESNDHEIPYLPTLSACSLCHLPYNEASVPFRVDVTKCAICRRAKVPDVLFTTIELPENIPMTGRGIFLQATVCKCKRDLRGELNAKEISDCLPFLEYELHSLLLNKLKVKGMNAIFGLKVQVSVGERLVIGMAVGTAVYLTALPTPSVPKIASGNSWHNEEQLAEIQKTLIETVRKNREFYRLKPIVEMENGRSIATSDTEESDDDLPDLDLGIGTKDACVLEVDDVEDMDRINLLMDERPPDDFHVVNTQTIPGLEDLEIVRNLQMFTQISRAKIPAGQFASMPSKYFARMLQTVLFKLRRMVPCALCDMQFKVALSDQDEIQLSVVGMALGLGEPTRFSKYKRKLIPNSTSKDPVKRTDENDMIFSLDEDQSDSTTVISQEPVSNQSTTNASNSSPMTGTSAQRHRPRSPFRTRTHLQHRHKHVPLKERYGVDITPLSYLPGGKIERYLGNLNFFFIRESTSIRENGGLSGFTHSFVTEILAIVRAHITALGGNAMVAFFMTQCVLLHSPHKNQGQSLINVGGDVVTVSYYGNDKYQGNQNC